MISWGSASTMTSVMLTWYSLSMTGMIQLKPAWANLLYLPSRLDQAPVGRPDDPDPAEEYEDDDDPGDDEYR